jgi:hypothetical protein
MKRIARRAFLAGTTGFFATAIARHTFSAAPETTRSVGYAATIGVNRLDPTHYGPQTPLRGCVNDAQDVRNIARLQGFECPQSLVDEGATRKNVIDTIRGAADRLNSGDIFLLHFSGHGASIPDLNGDETDGKDETWCLHDGMLIDDELARLWMKFREGVRILVLSDSCHSGTVTKGNAFNAVVQGGDVQFRGIAQLQEPLVFRFLPDDVSARVFQNNRSLYDAIGKEAGGDDQEIAASVLLISGCQDNQLSADLNDNGLFTAAVKQVWDGGKFTGNYRSFHAELIRRMPQTQSPNFYPIGNPDLKYWKQKPFTI